MIGPPASAGSGAGDDADRPTRVLVAAGGTAGHIEPALAVADALREIDPRTEVVVMGTERGLESRLVPARGYPLEIVDAVPLPRRPNLDLVRLPVRLRRATGQARRILAARDVDVVVGFGGYASLPAYLAARRRVPVVVHEANAKAGLANRVGARWAVAVACAVGGSGLRHAHVVGNPVRRSISGLDRSALRSVGREFFGLDPDAPTVLVTGGSQGAQHINEAVREVAPAFSAAGIGVLHHHGQRNRVLPVMARPPYVTIPYIDRMDLAYAAADLLVARSGAMTVAEAAAVGIPAVYVPLPHGNGEQRLNASAQVDRGAAVIIDDAEFTPQRVESDVIGLLADPQRFGEMRAAAGHAEGGRVDLLLARLVLGAARGPVGRRGRSHRGGRR
jgi:UDP-N-acetylglucosamine--N-acetylmuramyl-(pentapeptide) pyrophosphoryl-undecaprenol N-acetylglucosamine transferase